MATSVRFYFILISFCCVQQLIYAFNENAYVEFKAFVTRYHKVYSDEDEFWHRFKVFQNNLNYCKHLNESYADGTGVHGITKFSDLTQEDFKTKYLGDLMPTRDAVKTISLFRLTETLKSKAGSIPQYVDWRKKGIVSAVKNQQSCGACWAFSITETAESMYAKESGKPVSDLSVQEVIDCSVGNHGCAGGDTCTALDWLISSKKTLVYEQYYPLVDKTQTCQLTNHTAPGIKVINSTCINYVNKEDQMLELLSTTGPLAVTVDATTWNSYIGGIIKFHCPDFNNHAVEIVGYDLTGDVPYYIVRNSWGEDFGDKGYLYIKVGDNLCGLAKRVSAVQVQT